MDHVACYIDNVFITCTGAMREDHMWQTQVYEHYSTVSGLIRLAVSLECFIENTPFMND